MKLYRFIRAAETMRRHGGTPSFAAPRSYRGSKARRHVNEWLTEAYGALWRFRTKHPDSNRTAKARLRSIDKRQTRNFPAAER